MQLHWSEILRTAEFQGRIARVTQHAKHWRPMALVLNEFGFPEWSPICGLCGTEAQAIEEAEKWLLWPKPLVPASERIVPAGPLKDVPVFCGTQ